MSIQINGLTNPVLKNVQDRLEVAKTTHEENMTSEHIQLFYKNAPQNIIQAMQPYGYFNVKIQSKLIHQAEQWRAEFNITPGAPLNINTLDVQISGSGRNDIAFQDLLKKFPLVKGDVFEMKKYDDAKELLFQIANDQGYLKAYLITKVIRIDLKKNTVAIALHLDTGPRYYFGKVSFQQHTYADSFLQRFVNFHPGDPFSSPKLIKFQQNLSTSSYFKNVNVNPDIQKTENNSVPVNVDLSPSKSQQYNFGIGYGTFTGPRITQNTQLRHLTDTGHHLDLQSNLSEVLSGLTAQYVIPGLNPSTDQYSIGANAQRFAPKNGTSLSASLFAGYVKTIDEWKLSPTLTYLREHYDTVDEPSHSSKLLYPSFQIARTAADDLINTHFGSKAELILRGASSAIASNISFLQSDLKGKYIFSPTNNSRVITRAEYGYTTAKNVSLLPLSLQFFAGGLNSVRGFPYSYFGPGRYLKTGSVEVQHHIYGDVNAAAFYDVGTADDHINAAMGHGVGLGILYATPIGSAKVYVSYGYLQGKPRHFALDFSLGPDL